MSLTYINKMIHYNFSRYDTPIERAFWSKSFLNAEPRNGPVFNALSSSEEARKEVVGELSKIIPSLPPLKDTSVKALCTAVAEIFRAEVTGDGLSRFTEAITRITDAKEEECRRSDLSEDNDWEKYIGN